MSRFSIPTDVMVQTWDLLRRPGFEGLEAAAVWIGRRLPGGDVEIFDVNMPEQLAYRSEFGVAVTILDEALSRLIATLPLECFVPIRLHTHPGPAYHSDTDDQNMLLSHMGAISIVIPDFARDEIDLCSCSVNELNESHHWRELSPDEVKARFIVR
jgi:hypothetical protein